MIKRKTTIYHPLVDSHRSRQKLVLLYCSSLWFSLSCHRTNWRLRKKVSFFFLSDKPQRCCLCMCCIMHEFYFNKMISDDGVHHTITRQWQKREYQWEIGGFDNAQGITAKECWRIHSLRAALDRNNWWSIALLFPPAHYFGLCLCWPNNAMRIGACHGGSDSNSSLIWFETGLKIFENTLMGIKDGLFTGLWK